MINYQMTHQVYLVNSGSNSVISNGLPLKTYTTSQEAYDIADALQVEMQLSGADARVDIIVDNTIGDTVGDIVLTKPWNSSVYLIGLSSSTSAIRSIKGDNPSGDGYDIDLHAENIQIRNILSRPTGSSGNGGNITINGNCKINQVNASINNVLNTLGNGGIINIGSDLVIGNYTSKGITSKVSSIGGTLGNGGDISLANGWTISQDSLDSAINNSGGTVSGVSGFISISSSARIIGDIISNSSKDGSIIGNINIKDSSLSGILNQINTGTSDSGGIQLINVTGSGSVYLATTKSKWNCTIQGGNLIGLTVDTGDGVNSNGSGSSGYGADIYNVNNFSFVLNILGATQTYGGEAAFNNCSNLIYNITGNGTTDSSTIILNNTTTSLINDSGTDAANGIYTNVFDSNLYLNNSYLVINSSSVIADRINITSKNSYINLGGTNGSSGNMNIFCLSDLTLVDMDVSSLINIVGGSIFTGCTIHAAFTTITSGVSFPGCTYKNGIVSKNANNTMTILDEGCYMTTGATNRTTTLPAANTCKNKEYFFKKIDSSAGTHTINGGGTNIDGSSTLALTATQWKGARLKSNGTIWLIMSQF